MIGAAARAAVLAIHRTSGTAVALVAVSLPASAEAHPPIHQTNSAGMYSAPIVGSGE